MTTEANKLAVLSLLQQNARLSARELAERLALPEADVQRLIAACEKDNTIHGYHALVNPDALPVKVRALIEVSVQPERDHGFDHLARKMAKFPQVTDVTLVSGTFDLVLTVVGDNLQEVADFIATKLAPMAGIRHHSTHFVLKKYKESGFILDSDENYERLSVSP
jgi:DNA-binding Lrp family transcriptional regulator